jgi:hypothetical protein
MNVLRSVLFHTDVPGADVRELTPLSLRGVPASAKVAAVPQVRLSFSFSSTGVSLMTKGGGGGGGNKGGGGGGGSEGVG